MDGPVLASPDEAARAFAESGCALRMGPRNLRARGARTREEYLARYRRGLYGWDAVPAPVRRRLERNTRLAKGAARAAGFESLAAMPWRVVLSGPGAENGWAHTTGDVIVIPHRALVAASDEELQRLLVHEAVHVAQRRDRDGALRLVSGEWGFRPVTGARLRRVMSLGEARVNPDTDGDVYELDGRVCYPVLDRDAETLANIRLRPDGHHPRWVGVAENHEHPFEIMAEVVAGEAVRPR